jgi:cytochrome c553
MKRNRSTRVRSPWAPPLLLAAIAACFASSVARAGFEEDLARIDEALRTNPSRVMQQARDACMDRRRFAIELWETGQATRAKRSLHRCFSLLQIPEEAPERKVAAAPTTEDLEAAARREIESALDLTPDPARGLAIYRECAACHTPEGWGMKSGIVPQIAGQHRKVVIKQLADIRAGNRNNYVMLPYSSAESIGGPQAVADVAAYIDTLEISVDTGKGTGDDLALGEKLYRENCARCHGDTGEGNNDTFSPRIQSQHYGYLQRQFEAVRDGSRRNGNPEMAAQIQGFEAREENAVLDYVSRLEPPAALRAPEGWKNPDFHE